MKKQNCIICGRSEKNGIIIYGREICKCCEQRLINLDIDTDFYNYYKDSIKKTVTQFIVRGDEMNCPKYHF